LVLKQSWHETARKVHYSTRVDLIWSCDDYSVVVKVEGEAPVSPTPARLSKAAMSLLHAKISCMGGIVVETSIAFHSTPR